MAHKYVLDTHALVWYLEGNPRKAVGFICRCKPKVSGTSKRTGSATGLSTNRKWSWSNDV